METNQRIENQQRKSIKPKVCSFEKINKPLARLRKKKRWGGEMAKIRNKAGILLPTIQK